MLQQVNDILDNNQEKPKWGGPRPNSGRPKGPLPPERLEALAVKREFQQRVMKNAEELFNAQYNLAKGEQYLMCKYETGSGKNRKTVTEVVTDPETIRAYINGELEDEDEYYYISTKPAVGAAIDSLLDRTFGKADQKIGMEHSGKVGREVDEEELDAIIRRAIDYRSKTGSDTQDLQTM
jgi:hypothetical protein